jgi:hypothetical protein
MGLLLRFVLLASASGSYARQDLYGCCSDAAKSRPNSHRMSLRFRFNLATLVAAVAGVVFLSTEARMLGASLDDARAVAATVGSVIVCGGICVAGSVLFLDLKEMVRLCRLVVATASDWELPRKTHLQFTLRTLLIAVALLAVGFTGLSVLPPEERLMAVKGPFELAAWNAFLCLPVALMVVCFTAKGHTKRRAVVWIIAIWAACFFALTVGPLTPEIPDWQYE